MSEIKWIKIATDIFDNRKIKMIESLPDGDSIIVIWLKLLCLAGNINESGLIYFTKEIPYTDQMLSTQFNRPFGTVQMAMRTFEQFQMIEVIDDIIHVSNWEKYQNIEGMGKIREQTKERVARYRENKRIELCNATCNVTVTQCNATDKNRIDKDKNRLDIDILKEEKKKKKSNIELFKELYQDNLSGVLCQAVEEWLQYKDERKDYYQPTGMKSFLTIIKGKAEKYGDTKLVNVIHESMSSGYKGIVYDWLDRQSSDDYDALLNDFLKDKEPSNGITPISDYEIEENPFDNW